MFSILSIQSHVAYGYVGNKAITFPLQLLGNDVIVINTVQFSNRTAYGKFRGQIFDAEHIVDVMNGLYEGEFLDSCNAMLSGFIGDYTIGKVIVENVLKLKKQQKNKYNRDMLYCCDPVMGDDGRGFFVKNEIPEFMLNEAVPIADIITPNQFEAAYLTNMQINTLADIKLSAKKLYDMGPKYIVITSVMIQEMQSNTIGIIAYNGDEYYFIQTPYIDFGTVQLNGCGDLLSALFLHHMLQHNNVAISLERSVYSVYHILCETKKNNIKNNIKELAIIKGQKYISQPDIDKIDLNLSTINTINTINDLYTINIQNNKDSFKAIKII